MLQKFTAGVLNPSWHKHILNIYTYRGATGQNAQGGWYTSRFRIQGSVGDLDDTTPGHGYIEFNPTDDDGWGGGIGIYGNRHSNARPPLTTNKNGITVNSKGIVTIDTEWAELNKLIVSLLMVNRRVINHILLINIFFLD